MEKLSKWTRGPEIRFEYKEVVERVIPMLASEKAIVYAKIFGSTLTNGHKEPDEESDIDMMIIVDGSEEMWSIFTREIVPTGEESEIFYIDGDKRKELIDRIKEVDSRFSPRILTRKDVLKLMWSLDGMTFFVNSLLKGVRFYKRTNSGRSSDG
jgi:predicted nucleotidyltransferase